MPILKKTGNCRGCGSSLHASACCPNRPCLCCGYRHDRGVQDCPIYAAAKLKVAAAAAAAAADPAAAAAAAAKAAADGAAAKDAAATAAAAAKAATKAATKAAADQAKAATAAAKAARLQKDWDLYHQLTAAGTVVAQPSRSMFTEHNWGMSSSWTCPVCRGLATFCVCHQRV